jgi:hypothetical protein
LSVTDARRSGLARSSPGWTVFIAVFLLLSVATRVTVAFYLGDTAAAPPLLVDQVSYHSLAVRLTQGYGYSFGTGWYPFTPANTPTAHWSFLYSLFLAGTYLLFGPHPIAARLIQAVLAGILLPWGAYRLAERLFPDRPRVPPLALAAAAGYSYFALYAATLMTESLFIVCVLWSLTAALDQERALVNGEQCTARLGWSLGLWLGLATLLRQSILPWVAILFLWLLWRERSNVQTFKRSNVGTPLGWRLRLRPLILATAVLVACILPFTVRNYRVYGRFMLLNSNAGYAMYSAQHPMHGTDFREYDAAPIPVDLVDAGLNEAELDPELMRRGIGFVLEDPVRYLRLSWSRLLDYLSILPEEATTPLHAVGRIVGFGLYAPFMLYGLILVLASPKRRERSSLALLFMLCYSVLHVLTWAMVRYRLPVDAVAMPFAALTVDDLLTRVSHRALRGDAAAPSVDETRS